MNVQHLFDGIDDKTVEDNIAFATQALEMNKRNRVHRDFEKEFPLYMYATVMRYAD